MFKSKFLLISSLILAMVVSPAAYAAVSITLDSFSDQTPATINLPATKLLMASVGTGTQGGGQANDATATTVTIGGTVAAADIAQVCVDYGGTEVACVTSPGSLTNISISLPGSQGGGAIFDYRVTLNPSAAGKTMLLSVVDITATGNVINNVLPASTAERPISGGATAPTLSSPTATVIDHVSATLGATIDTDGGDTVTAHGTAWNTAGTPTTSDNANDLGSAGPGYPDTFSSLRDTPAMPSGTRVFYRGYATNVPGTSYSPQGSFYTEPATQASGVNFTTVGSDAFTVNWTAGSGVGRLVVMRAGSAPAAPTDGVVYTASSTFGSGSSIGGDSYVVATTGTSVSVTGLTSDTTYHVAVYEYAGTVADAGDDQGINYKPTPATGSQLTTLVLSAPTVTTPTAVNITHTAADLGGTITDDGGDTVTQHGTVFNYTGTPTVADNPSNEGPAGAIPDTFTTTRSPLTSGARVFYRGYATNNEGTSYSPQGSFYTEPATQASGVNFTTVGSDAFTVNWSAGSGVGRLVVMRAGSAPAAPTDGVVYTASSTFGSGSSIGGDSYVVATTGTSVSVTGLTSDTTYHVAVYEYAGTVADAGDDQGINYKPTPATGSQLTTLVLSAPTVTTPTAVNITHTAADLGGTITDDGGDTVTQHGTVFNYTGTPTVADNPSNEGPAGAIPDTFTTTRSPLTSGARVYYRAFATNGEGTSYSPQGSFYTEPATQATGVNFTTVGSNAFTVNWTAGSGVGRLVVMRAGSAPAAPTDGVVYTASSTFGSGSPIGGDSYVVATTGTSVSVTGLTSDTTYHVAVYEYAGTVADAGDDQGINYKPTPATGSQLTDTAAETQASNLAFATTAGQSVHLTWTRGSREGVIVVMRLTATGPVPVGPTEGVDYTGDPDFSAPPPTTGAGNYVVYKGPGTSVLVTRLTMSTSYSVAVYEYSGTGATSSYLAGPAEATDSTTDYAVHNYDNRVNCNDCHNHGSFGARGPELKAICSTCHNPSGLADTKLEFGFEETPTTTGHPTPTKNIDIDVVDCGMCHELHKITTTSTNTTYSTHSETLLEQHNKSFLRANVDKYVTNAATPAYLHTDTPGVSTPDRAVEGGNDTTARGYCQVCHTLTDYHRSSNTAGSDQCHDGASNTSCGPAEVTCGLCHDHNNNFAGAGGSCTGCHSLVQPSVDPIRPVITTQFDRNSAHIPGGSAAVTSEDCEVCHDQTGHPGDQLVGLVDADDGVTLYSQSGTPGTSTLATGEGEVFAPACLSCHDSNGASRLPAYVDTSNGQTDMSPFTGVFYDPPPADPVVRFPEIDATNWANASHNRPVATSGSSPVTCVGNGANGCHASGHGSESNSLLASWDGVIDPNTGTPASSAPVSPIDFCYNCHDGDGPSSKNIFAQFNTTTNYQAEASSGNLVNQRHDITAADQTYSGGAVSCNDCHSPHADNATNPVFTDLHTGTELVPYDLNNSYTGDLASFSYNSGGNNDPMNPVGISTPDYTEPDYVQFCLACHDGTAPPGVTLPAAMTNMAVRYNGTNQHGSGDGSGTSKGYLKYPWNTQGVTTHPGAYAAINCTTCHGAHGSANIFNLRESITVAGVQMRVGGWDDGTDGIGNPRAPYNCGTPGDPATCSTVYKLPPMSGKNIDEAGGVQENRIWGAWCSFCHQMESHSQSEDATCNSGHVHGGGNF